MTITQRIVGLRNMPAALLCLLAAGPARATELADFDNCYRKNAALTEVIVTMGRPSSNFENIFRAAHNTRPEKRLVFNFKKRTDMAPGASDGLVEEELSFEISPLTEPRRISIPNRDATIHYTKGGLAWLHHGAGVLGMYSKGTIIASSTKNGYSIKLDLQITLIPGDDRESKVIPFKLAAEVTKECRP